jgi:hypothetical protein
MIDYQTTKQRYRIGSSSNNNRTCNHSNINNSNNPYLASMFGLSVDDLASIEEKLYKQRSYINNLIIKDKLNNNTIKVKDIVMSAYHSPHKYYGEVQNRINSLMQYARENNLEPLFMTITLPSEYHPKKTTMSGKLIANPKYNGASTKESSKELTRLFARLRHDRSMKDLPKEQRVYFRVTEPHKDGTPHAHILLCIPRERIERVIAAFHRLYKQNIKSDSPNDIQKITDEINNAVSYIMKYINKTLPLSKQENKTIEDDYRNAWYSSNRIIRFLTSRTLAPLSVYRLVHEHLSLYALTKLYRTNVVKAYEDVATKKIMEVYDGDTLIYMKNINFSVVNLNYVDDAYHQEVLEWAS